MRRSTPSSHRGTSGAAARRLSVADASKTPRTRARKSRSPNRLALVFTLIVLAFGLLGARLVMLQILDAPAYAKIALDQRKRVETFPARRGTIFDRQGESLAISVDMQTIWADPQLVDDPEGEAAQLAPLIGQKKGKLAELLRGTMPGSRFEYIARQIEPRIARQIEQLELAGIYMKPEAKRVYPNDRLASHVLGLADVDGNGIAGIEVQYDDILQGTPGRMVLEQDPAGNWLPQADLTYERALPGRSLFLTIDKEIQYFTEMTLARATEAYNAKAATAIVMKPETGEILAMANVPDFDPNRASDFDVDAQRNRALTDEYEPGSIFKAVTMAAALEERVVTPETTFVVPDTFPYIDRVFHDSHPHPTEVMTVSDILTDSSNVGTIKVGLELGAERLDEYISRFGFGSPTGLDFEGEADGNVRPLEEWYGTTIATVPIGQGIAVTAMQMATAYSTLANEGVWTEPKLMSATVNDEGDIVPASEPARKRVVSRRAARAVTKMMVRVVDEGTGIEAQVPGYIVAGKTGTAQKVDPETGGYGEEYVASFAGYAPAKDPEIVIVVSFDEPDEIYGGSTAAPTFSTIAEFALRRLGVPPQEDAAAAARETAAEEAGAAPAHD
ncbi:MAG: penicillin-binding protein 2 [Actinomycetota bacterium]|nr:penicillin-binding protein 2 [Actinomycetota bacterium]